MTHHADAIARALLYEGYLLYPYRSSALKNQQRWPLGVLYPATWSSDTDPCAVHTEVLVEGDRQSSLDVSVHFLHLVDLNHDASRVQPAVERFVALPTLPVDKLVMQGYETVEVVDPHEGCGGEQNTLQLCVRVRAEYVRSGLYKVIVELRNVTPCDLPYHNGQRQKALTHALLSTHSRLHVRGGTFVSLLEPPERLAEHAAHCRNKGAWPVLVGRGHDRTMMLCSPVILYDYPRIAPQSPGDLFDGTEIDEILTLRILTLTDDEKAQIRATDPRAAALLDRTEALTGNDLLQMHGMVRRVHRDAPPGQWTVRGVPVRAGSKVRLQPTGRSDIFDLALAGKDATIVAIEQDLEDRVLIAVTVDDDPGRDLGAVGQVGHRFFFRPEELEVVGT